MRQAAPSWFSRGVLDLPAGGTALLLLLAPLETLDPRPVLLGNAPVGLIEIAVGVVVLAVAASTPWRQMDLRVLLWGAPWLVAVGAAAAWNIENYKVVPYLLRESTLLLVLFAQMNALQSERQRLLWLRVVGVVALVFGVATVVEFVRFYPARPRVAFFNSTALAGFLGLLLIVAVGVAAMRVPRRWRFGWKALTVLLTVALVLTFSRTGFAAGIAGVAMLLWLQAIDRSQVRSLGSVGSHLRSTHLSRWVLILALPFGIATLAAASGVRFSGDWLVERYSTRGLGGYFSELRMPGYRIGWQLWRQHPGLGIGPGRYGTEVAPYVDELSEQMVGLSREARDRVTEPIRHHLHSTPLQVAVDFGLLGLTGLAAVVTVLARVLWRGRAVSRWAAPGLAMLVAFCLANLLDNTLRYLEVEFGLLLGLVLSSIPRESGDA